MVPTVRLMGFSHHVELSPGEVSDWDAEAPGKLEALFFGVIPEAFPGFLGLTPRS
jgi:hypothetical protein